MGAVDVKKQAPNVARMKILGARVIEVTDGLQTLKEAVDAAFAAYCTSTRTPSTASVPLSAPIPSR